MILRLTSNVSKMIFPTFLVLLFCLNSVNSLAVMSVDLGAEWMKVAVVSPGVPMEIALNPQSQRKTNVAVAFRDGERTFGSDAMAVAVKYPKNCYFYLLDLLGKKIDHPSVKLYQERFPYYTIEADPERGTVIFRHDEETTFSVEELVGMILSHAKDIAEDYTDQKLRDAVITVPVYYNQAERRALMVAAELANLNVLQLITEPMATALNYGMFRRKEINGTVKHLVFYEMGAYDTTATIVSYQIIKTKERGFTETHPQAQILGIGYDRTLGGLALQIKLRDYLADEFNALKKTKTDVRTVPRAMAKLFTEAGKVKNVLSANAAIYAQIENLLENIDVKIEVKREKLLELNEEFFARVTKPIEVALMTSSVTMEEISEVILMGAGTRVPRVQELLSEYLVAHGHKGNGELGKSLNTDEAAAMGAVYKAADLSTGFKVKKFITRDAVVFPIDVDFERHYADDDSGDAHTKTVKRSLFVRMNQFPQKKIMTFNKHVQDFTFNVNLNDLDYLSAKEIGLIGGLNLSKVSVKGVAAALEKHIAENIESKGIKAHFSLDESGMIHVTGVEAVFEKNITVAEQEALEKKEGGSNSTEGEDGEKKDDAWAKLGDTISSFFGDKKEGESEDGDESTGENNSESGKKEEKKKSDKKEDKKKDEKKPAPKKEPKKPKIETLKEPLEFEVALTDLANMTADQKKASREKLDALTEHDRAKKARGMALNALESFVINTRDKLEQDFYIQSSTEEEREKIREKFNEVSDWIDEEATIDTELTILESKLKELKDLTATLFARIREHTDRPEALEALTKMVNTSEYFLGKAKNSTGIVDGYFTATELETLEKKLAEIKLWKEKAEKEQAEQPMHEMPKLTTSLIAEKGVELDREVKYLVNKAKIAKAEKDRERMRKEAEERQKAEEKKKADEKEKKKKKKKEKANNETKDEVKDETKADEVKEQTEEQAAQKEEEPVLSDDKLEPEVDDSLNIEEDESERADDATANETGNEEAVETEEKEEEDIPDVEDEDTEKKEEQHTEL